MFSVNGKKLEIASDNALSHTNNDNNATNHNNIPGPPTTTLQQQQSSTYFKKQAPILNHEGSGISSLAPITQQYELNDHVLQAFYAHHKAQYYQVAYAVGVQFVETALLEIPRHGYFLSPRHERDRMQSRLDAVKVLGLLQDLLKSQKEQNSSGDPQTTANIAAEQERLEQLQTLALEQVQQASEDQYTHAQEKQQLELQEQLRRESISRQSFSASVSYDMPYAVATQAATSSHAGTTSTNNSSSSTSNQNGSSANAGGAAAGGGGGWVVLEPLLSCSESMSNVLCDNNNSNSATAAAVASTTAAAQGRSLLEEQDMAVAAAAASVEDASWVQVSPSADDILLEKALFLSGLEVTSVVVPSAPASANSSVTGIGDDRYAVATPIGTVGQQEDDDAAVARAIAEQEQLLQQSTRHHKKNAATIADQAQKPAATTTTATEPSTRRPPSLSQQPQLLADTAMPTNAPQRRKSRLELQTLSALYHDDFDQLLRVLGRIQLVYIETWQGRVAGSTNGCTVIAPLMCIHHLLETSALPPDNDGLDQETISQVIDMETPLILSELREQHGLSDQAFLIPSDVHDYLIQNGQLHSTQFVNVLGGNILDESHITNLIEALNGNPNKLAATLFFHEHVVAILKIRKSKTESYFDIIDSLPMKETLMFADETQLEFLSRHGHDTSNPNSEALKEELGHIYMDRTAVFRCLDTEALKACLRWYACSKFNPSNIQYIDSYDWDDSKFADFDPRVFQAFIWGTAPMD